ncbi:recombinase family protein [[Clostridium] scindens]|uniref:recombinase family protein n=1 Tax=Clostridium scindens (strain JCM 10418 / VPI 12708) TaxID=29347 RepID=UPI00156F89E5|nr:recombinase family protein [[Clostridium] scindens]NSI90207.1 recombinase family protein [[Clostridium] scindens]NSJ04780.1 recombinase family protein [[Clostridium] scindens]
MNQNISIPSKIRAEHLNREALVYVRQSTMAQVRLNQESTQRQYALQERALSLGWPEEHIRVIDGDLGISGSGRSKRPGFAQLVTSVSLGEVGAVFGLEISRLARSSADLMKLLELCGLFGTLVIDEDGIYDMSDFNDRLLIGLKGTMGEAELHFLHARMIGGKENAASRGELRFPLPVGYIYGHDGKTIMDPDEEVRHAISTLFQVFRTSGSAYGVVRYFAENNLSFPKRAYGGAWDGKLTWGTLTHSRVLGVIHNPAYAGAYVYGRYRDHKTIDADGHFEHHPVRLPDKEDWKAFLPGHHQAYISWEEFEDNQKRLDANRTNTERCGHAREGGALLTGVLVCGKCGRRMTVRYTGTGGIRPLYECIGRWEHGNKATCSSVPAEALDHAVSEKILAIMKPSELEISLKVMRSIHDANRLSEKQWLLSIERAQYEADRAERQFMLADPENRLVVRSLESNWNQKFKELEKAKQDYATHNSQKAWVPSEKEEQDILDLAHKIPEIWNASTSTPKEKKRIIRILIDDITVLAEKRDPDFSIGIRFRRGKCEQLSLKKSIPYSDRRKHTDSTVSRIQVLAAAMSDSEIAEQLNQDGWTTPEGKAFTYAGVRWLRCKHGISSPYQRNRMGISVAEASTLLGISTGKVYYGISTGKIPARKQHPGWPWEILIDDSNLEAIKALYT